MQTHKDIIHSINLKIENSTFERFPIEHVINELNNTYRDLANKTSLFETHDYLKLEDAYTEYTLPNRIVRPTRAVFRNQSIDFVSQEAMDLQLPGWEGKETANDLEYLVYNNLSDRLIKTYPRLTDVKVPITLDSSSVVFLGELSGLDKSTATYLWQNINSGAKYFSSKPFGTISGFDFTEVVTIYGAYLPDLVTEEFMYAGAFIDELYINALIYGTAGNLLFTSGRTEDAQKAQNFMRLYGVDESEVAAIRKKDFTGGFRNTARNNQYRTPFSN